MARFSSLPPRYSRASALEHIGRLRAKRAAGELLALVVGGQGLAPAATTLLCEWGFRALSLRRIELLIDPTNVASHRVAERLGAVTDGLARHPANDGSICEMVRYSLSPPNAR